MGAGPVTTGAPAPLGVRPAGDGVDVAVWSTAEAVDFCLFDADGREQRIGLTERTGPVFHAHVAGVGEGARYGFRAHGRFDPASGARFDPSKLLTDPYAVALDGPFVLHPAMFSSAAREDSAPFMPKAVVSPLVGPAVPPLVIPWDRTVIYEAHVKGLTRLHPAVPEGQRGTFAALGHPAVVRHLQDLGVTTLELLPVAAWIDERHLPPLGLTNYWGYNPVAFCAPDPRLAPGGWAEVRAATAALAEAGIETVLDVVFNHTGEGDALGPTLSLRGLDNAGYYRLQPREPARYVDDSGTGNTLALDRPQSVALVMEALRTWVRRGGVSGFRFDLAPVLGRRAEGFDPEAPLLSAIDQDPELRGLKLIAEPWDCGPGGHQLGRFPPLWGEWNDGFRDRVRRFWRPGGGESLGPLASALAGSQDQMRGHGRPSRSVNFVTAHDGFTLRDLVSYEAKHNEANGEDNRDGTDRNESWNNGVEGEADDPVVLARRAADQRALLAALLLSRGTPMLSMGAELGHSQGGNNNAYAQDNAIGWIDWARADAALTAFTARLTAARARHPALRQDRFLTGAALQSPYPDVEWLRADGAPMQPADWDDPSGAALVAIFCARGGDGPLDRAIVAVHRAGRAAQARLPPPRDRHRWRLLVDSADDRREEPLDDEEVVLAPRSVVLLVEEASPRRSPAMDDETLARIAAEAGIATAWWTLDGRRIVTRPDTQRALLRAMGLPADTDADARESLWRLAEPERRALPACRVVREGEALRLPVRAPDGWLEAFDEQGGRRAVRLAEEGADLSGLPVGRWRLAAGSQEGRLIVAPRRAHEPVDAEARRLGVLAQLYSLRGARDGGMGDFGTLAELAAGAAGQGLELIALNPFHMLFPADRSRASPYYPSDRRFIDPIHIDVSRLGRAPSLAGAQPAEESIDYARVWRLKAAALEQAFARFEASAAGREAFEAFVREGGAALQDFAVFHAIAETRPGEPWRLWPEGLAGSGGPAVARFAAEHAGRVRFHQYLQWLAEGQLAEAARAAPGIGLCRDLAVGAAPDGAEIWARRDRFAEGVSIGAPPDPFSPQGQVWGLPPPDPRRWTAEGYEGFSQLLRANMRHAGALRIDHVLGLSRLFWVPEGGQGEDGAYVAYPMQDLLGVVALESARSRCLVIGEDLGTAPEGLRPALEESGIYSYRVLPFERDGAAFRPPPAYPRRALACVSTHDLPPLAGWWEGEDLGERRALGLLDDTGFEAALAVRRTDKTALLQALANAGIDGDWSPSGPLSTGLAAAIHAYVAQTGSVLAVAQLDDLAAETVGVNLPGTDAERPNWRRRLSPTLAELWRSERSLAILAAMRQARASSS